MSHYRSLSTRENQRQQRERKQTEYLAKLDKIVENSSEKNRNFFVAYLILLVYVQAIIFSTTDLQLLVFSEGLKLPIIDLTVPLMGFYVVIPIFIIALHFNFFQNLESHHYKLMRWQQAHPDGKVPRSNIYPFLFDYAMLERNGQLLRWVRWANSLLCYNLAPITLGLLLIRFSDQQNILVTSWHYLAFVFDAYLVWKLRLAMKDNQQTEATPDSAHWLMRCRCFCTDIFRHGLHGVFGLFILLETVLTLLIGGTSNDVFAKYVLPQIELISRYSSNVDEQSYRKSIEWILPRIAINPNEIVWKPDVPALETSAKLSGYSDWVKYFNEKGEGFRPILNSLRLIQLSLQALPRVQLASAQLQGANLTEAQLQGANLSEAQLQGANLTEAQLQGAELWGTRLQGADLTEAQLQGADLRVAQLQGANLSEAQLQGANLTEAQLQGAYLRGAQLQGANLLKAQLQGAILYETFIQYALNIDTLEAAVFGRSGQSNLFYKENQVWNYLEKLAETIPNEQNREQYIENIHQAENSDQTGIVEQKLRYKPAEIAQTALSKICARGELNQTPFLAVQAFRRRYLSLYGSSSRYFESHKADLKQYPDYQALLKDIDHKLCTLDKCVDLRKDIEGLDCKAYIRSSN